MLKHKYKAKRCEHDGLKFPSLKEGRRYLELKLLRQAGDVVMFLRQPQFDLPGGAKYSADFLIFWKEGHCTVEDVKGFQTKDFKLKKKMVESLYPITLEVI